MDSFEVPAAERAGRAPESRGAPIAASGTSPGSGGPRDSWARRRRGCRCRLRPGPADGKSQKISPAKSACTKAATGKTSMLSTGTTEGKTPPIGLQEPMDLVQERRNLLDFVQRGWAPRKRVRSAQGDNRVGRPETEQTGATRGETHLARRSDSTVPVRRRGLGTHWEQDLLGFGAKGRPDARGATIPQGSGRGRTLRQDDAPAGREPWTLRARSRGTRRTRTKIHAGSRAFSSTERTFDGGPGAENVRILAWFWIPSVARFLTARPSW